jgi:hypothetical protein
LPRHSPGAPSGPVRADNYDDRVTTTTMAGLVACFG